MSLADMIRAAQLPAPAVCRRIREDAGAALRDIAEEMAARGQPVTPTAVMRWEHGDAVPRRDKAIIYRTILDELRAVAQ